jgi:hypothetical protein
MVLDFVNELKLQNCGVILTISSPVQRQYKNIINVIYAQHALKCMPREWSEYVNQYDGVIIPGQFDFENFS